VPEHVSALGSEAALAAAPGPDLVSSLPGNKGPPLPPLPNHSKRNEMERKEWGGKGRRRHGRRWEVWRGQQCRSSLKVESVL